MAYFEMSIINGKNHKDFEISCNEDLYYYLCGHDNAHGGEDWFDITLNDKDVKEIQELCKTNEEKELIGQNVQEGSIIDVLIHHSILIGGE